MHFKYFLLSNQNSDLKLCRLFKMLLILSLAVQEQVHDLQQLLLENFTVHDTDIYCFESENSSYQVLVKQSSIYSQSLNEYLHNSLVMFSCDEKEQLSLGDQSFRFQIRCGNNISCSKILDSLEKQIVEARKQLIYLQYLAVVATSFNENLTTGLKYRGNVLAYKPGVLDGHENLVKLDLQKSPQSYSIQANFAFYQFYVLQFGTPYFRQVLNDDNVSDVLDIFNRDAVLGNLIDVSPFFDTVQTIARRRLGENHLLSDIMTQKHLSLPKVDADCHTKYLKPADRGCGTEFSQVGAYCKCINDNWLQEIIQIRENNIVQDNLFKVANYQNFYLFAEEIQTQAVQQIEVKTDGQVNIILGNTHHMLKNDMALTLDQLPTDITLENVNASFLIMTIKQQNQEYRLFFDRNTIKFLSNSLDSLLYPQSPFLLSQYIFNGQLVNEQHSVKKVSLNRMINISELKSAKIRNEYIKYEIKDEIVTIDNSQEIQQYINNIFVQNNKQYPCKQTQFRASFKVENLTFWRYFVVNMSQQCKISTFQHTFTDKGVLVSVQATMTIIENVSCTLFNEFYEKVSCLQSYCNLGLQGSIFKLIVEGGGFQEIYSIQRPYQVAKQRQQLSQNQKFEPQLSKLTDNTITANEEKQYLLYIILSALLLGLWVAFLVCAFFSCRRTKLSKVQLERAVSLLNRVPE